MNNELEVLKIKLDTAKTNIQLEISRLTGLSVIFFVLLGGVLIPLFFKFGFDVFIIIFLIIILIYTFLFSKLSKRLLEARIEYFIFGIEFGCKSKVNLKKLNRNLDNLREKVKELKLFGIFRDNKKLLKELQKKSRPV